MARKWLDVGPSPVHPPDISLDAFAPTPAFAFRAFVYIDESGRVTGLEFEGDVPPEMAALIRRRFLETRFTPGLVKGVPVRCWTTFEFRVE